MLKAGIITGMVGLFFAVGLTLLSPVCVPCLALFLGIVAGFLAGGFDKPGEGSATVKTGALAGLIAGIVLALGQIIGAGINSILVGPEGTAQLLESFGMYSGIDATGYWLIVACSTLCFGVIDMVLMAGFGVLGALVWGVFLRKDVPSPSKEMEMD